MLAQAEPGSSRQAPLSRPTAAPGSWHPPVTVMGSYPYAGSAASYAGYSPSLRAGRMVAAPAGSTVVVTHPRHRSHSRHRHEHSHSDDGHHHHHQPRRRTSVEVIQTGGGSGRPNYVPYSTGGYAAPGYAGYTPGYGGYAPGYGGYAPGYGGYAPGYGGYGYG